MKKEFEQTYHKVEKSHFWFKSRRNYIVDFLKDFPRDSFILDIGSSSGILLTELIEVGFNRENLYGVDISEDAIRNCKENGIPNAFVMDAQNISLDVKFDVIIASDCLEHLQDDSAAVTNWIQHLKPHGTLIVFVPAFMSLWSSHDDANMHFRRYSLPQLKKLFASNSLNILKASYWNFLLFTPVYFWRRISNIKKKKNMVTSDLDEPGRFNSLLLSILNTENKILKVINFPIGISAFCIVKNSPKQSHHE